MLRSYELPVNSYDLSKTILTPVANDDLIMQILKTTSGLGSGAASPVLPSPPPAPRSTLDMAAIQSMLRTCGSGAVDHYAVRMRIRNPPQRREPMSHPPRARHSSKAEGVQLRTSGIETSETSLHRSTRTMPARL